MKKNNVWKNFIIFFLVLTTCIGIFISIFPSSSSKNNHTHTGGTATVNNQAICSICGRPYGEKIKRQFVFTLTLSRVVNNATIGVELPEDTPTTIVVYDGDTISLPTAKALDSEEYQFSCWKYKNDNGSWEKLESESVINSNLFSNIEFVNESTVNIELVAFCSSLWGPIV